MGRTSSYLKFFDKTRSISVSDLKQLGYLEGFRSGLIKWESGSCISILVDLINNGFYAMVLDYACNGRYYKYTVQMNYSPSNLGKGRVWYFICPQTGKRCNKLYFITERFLSRHAFESNMYSCQAESKRERDMRTDFGCFFQVENAYKEIYKKHFKKYYNGQPTKRYIRLNRIVQKGSRIDPERLLQAIKR